ncbi:DNRLRE domain-containing protein [Lentzea rhizosphaerae]|uniref:DNRLRE domain-containing protein n=1 Tax=Lentzea rhizosphaerae TaxID=2041025 RepID=A0ABV8C866_9PSEU
MVLIVALPIVSGSQAPLQLLGALPQGASTAAPEQRTGKADSSTHEAPADSTRARRDLPRHDQPRPGNAVPDQAAPLPEVQKYTHEQQKAAPKVGRPEVPAIDPKAVERPGDRTATTQTFDNPDGSRTLRLHTGQVNVQQPDGSWKPVDTALTRGDRVRPKVFPLDLSFAATGADPALVTVAFDGDHQLSYGLRDAADVRGDVQGSQITYRGVRPGTDVRLTAVSGGVKEDVVLASASAPASHLFTLKLKRLQPRLGADGAVELVDGGKVIASIPAGFMDDAAGTRSTGVRYGLEKSGDDTWTLRVDLDEAWLRDPARVFPVVMDPTIGQFNLSADDTYVRSNGGDQSGAPELEVGYVEGNPLSRTYLRFGDLGVLRNQYVVAASLAMANIYSSSCAATGVTVFEVTQPWGSSMRWPGAAVGQALSTRSFAHGAPGTACAAPAWEPFPLDPDLMTRWTHGGALNHGLSVRATDETVRSGKRFASANTPSNKPYLEVRYSPEGAAFDVTQVTLPTNTRAGQMTAAVTNQGAGTWTPSNGVRFGYIVKQGDRFVRTSTFAPSGSVGPMASTTFDVPIDPLEPGDYQLYLSMFTPQGQDYFVAHGVPYGRIDLKVNNVPPTSDYQQPGSGAVVETLRPTLYAEGVDDDNWPNRGLTYMFRICTNPELTENCEDSPWTAQSWAPSGLRWAKTYYWGVKTNDTVDSTPNWVGPLVLSTRVPQPQITSHLAGNPDGQHGRGLDPNIGNYSTVVTDASVGTAGPDLTITRTYNSLDPRRDTAFGIGWASRLDMRITKDDDRSGNVVVTYPTGRQVRFGQNPDGTFGSPLGDSTDLVYAASTGVYTLRDNSGGKWEFDALGRLVTITDSYGLTEQLTYEGDHVREITNGTSGRKLLLTWEGVRVATVSTEAPEPGAQPLVWTYTYTGENLTRACVPGSATNCTDYSYANGSHYLSTVLDDRPSAYWRLGESTGDSFVNVVARQPGENAATPRSVVLGGAGALAGTSDKAAVFDGNSSFATLPDDLTKGTMSLAVELWFKTTSHGTLISYADQPFPTGTPTRSTPALYVGTDGLLYSGLSLRANGGPRQIVSTTTVANGQWHHAVLSAAIDTQTLYLDGNKVGELAGFVDARQQGKLSLGAGVAKDWPATNGGNFHFNGSIDEVAIYQHPLGSLAARQHHEARKAIDQLTTITLPQDDRQFAKLTYDDLNDRVKTLVDHEGRTWSTDTPKIEGAKRTAVLRGPSNHGEWTHEFDNDNGGRQTSVSHDGAKRSFYYNTEGFRSATVDEVDRRIEETTDNRGNVLSRKTCRVKNSCNTSYFSYIQSTNPLDPRRDKMASSSDARSANEDDSRYRTRFEYDIAGRLTTTTYPVPDGQAVAPREVNTYSTGNEDSVYGGKVPAGLLIKTTGRRDQETLRSYRANGDLGEVRDPVGLRVQYSYDAIGRRKSITTANAGGAVFGSVALEYTPRSQLAKVTESAVKNEVTAVSHRKVTSYTYDDNGNMLTTTSSDGLGVDATRTTVMTYDAHDRLATTRFPDGGLESRSYRNESLVQIVTDVNGTVWNSVFDENGLLLSRGATGANVDPEDPSATGLLVESHIYDVSGVLRASDDAIGRRTEFTYYDDGLLATKVRKNYVRPDGGVQDVTLEDRTYDPAGNLTQVVTPGGRKTVETYDAANYLTSSTFDPDGLKRATTYFRDLDGNPVRIEMRGAADPNRVETKAFEYDGANRVIRENASLNATTAFSTRYDRDERGLVESFTDRRQLTTTYRYDAIGRVVSTTKPPTEVWVAGAMTTGFAATETLGYNAFGELTHSRDASGAVTTTERDSMGRATVVAAPDYTPPGGTVIKSTVRTEHDHGGRARKVTDPLNRVTTYDYDPYGRVITTTLPQVGNTPSVIRKAYNRVGELVGTTDPSGAQVLHTYDELGRQLTVTETDRSSGTKLFYATRTAFDLAGNAVAITNPMNATETRTFDLSGAELTRTDPTNRRLSYTYDNAGRVATSTDPAGVVTALTYDLLGRNTRSAQLVGGVEKRATTFGYDPAGNRVSEVSPEGRPRTYVFDGIGRIVRQVEKVDSSKSITTSFGYDKAGNRSRLVDGRGKATDYAFNSLRLIESVVEPATAANQSLADRTWTSSYNAAGELVKLVKPGGVTVTREYDAQGRVSVERGTGAEAASDDRTFSYDLAGRVIGVGSARGDSGFGYDDRGQLLRSYGAGGTATYTYNGDRTLATRDDATGKATFGYDKTGRLTSVADPLSGRTVDYGYDRAGRLSLISDRSVSGWANRQLSYDELGRLASDQLRQIIDSGLPPSILLGTDYTYDLDDKVRAKKSTTNTSVSTNSYEYDGVGRLTSWTDNAGTKTDYRWDDSGNRVGVGATTYTYDERNRLTSGGGATYTYTARGTVSSVVENGQTKNSAFDAFDRMVTSGAVQYSYDGLDRVITRNGKAFQYAGLSNEAVSDGTRLISRSPSGKPISDKAVGSTAKGKMLFADQRGDVVGRYLGAAVDGLKTFDPFGKLTGSSGDVSPLGYQGDWTDGDTGTVNMTARWYSPTSGQFASRDDWTLNPVPSVAANRYTYGNADPVNGADPSGHCFWDACIVEGWAIGTAVVGLAALTAGLFIVEDATTRDWDFDTTTDTVAVPDVARLPNPCSGRCKQERPEPWKPRGDQPKPPSGCTSCPPPLPPAPPPPPPWLVNALKALPKLAEGAITTLERVNTIKKLLRGRDLIDNGQRIVDEVTFVTKDGYQHEVNSPRPTNSDTASEDRNRCLTSSMPTTIWYAPLESVDTGQKRAQGAAACFKDGYRGKDRNPLEDPDGYSCDNTLANARGHLIANCLGGADILENLVPLNQNATNNSMMYHRVEARVAERLKAGESIYYQVIPVYSGQSVVPDTVQIFARGDMGFKCVVDIPNVTARPATFKGC